MAREQLLKAARTRALGDPQAGVGAGALHAGDYLDAARRGVYSWRMPTEQEVRTALEDLEQGAELHVELADGREITGTYAGEREGRLVLDDVDVAEIALGEQDGIALGDVARVSEVIRSEGPE